MFAICLKDFIVKRHYNEVNFKARVANAIVFFKPQHSAALPFEENSRSKQSEFFGPCLWITHITDGKKS